MSATRAGRRCARDIAVPARSAGFATARRAHSVPLAAASRRLSAWIAGFSSVKGNLPRSTCGRDLAPGCPVPGSTTTTGLEDGAAVAINSAHSSDVKSAGKRRISGASEIARSAAARRGSPSGSSSIASTGAIALAASRSPGAASRSRGTLAASRPARRLRRR